MAEGGGGVDFRRHQHNEKGVELWLAALKKPKRIGSMWTKSGKRQQYIREMDVMQSKIGTTIPSDTWTGAGSEA